MRRANCKNFDFQNVVAAKVGKGVMVPPPRRHGHGIVLQPPPPDADNDRRYTAPPPPPAPIRVQRQHNSLGVLPAAKPAFPPAPLPPQATLPGHVIQLRRHRSQPSSNNLKAHKLVPTSKKARPPNDVGRCPMPRGPVLGAASSSSSSSNSNTTNNSNTKATWRQYTRVVNYNSFFKIPFECFFNSLQLCRQPAAAIPLAPHPTPSSLLPHTPPLSLSTTPSPMSHPTPRHASRVPRPDLKCEVCVVLWFVFICKWCCTGWRV